MQNKNYHVKLLVGDGDIDFNSSVYAGYTKEEVAYHVHAYQGLYRGDSVFEIINAKYELYYLHCKKGDSTRGQVDYIVSNTGILLINANGNLYKHDLNTKENLSIEAFHTALFDNTQSEYYPSLYLLSLASQEYGLMAIVDTNGIALLNFDGVLWRYEHEWAYDGCVVPVAFTKDSLMVQSDDIRYNEPHIFHLDLKNGLLLE